MKERKRVFGRFAGVVTVTTLIGSAVAALPGFAGESKWQIKNGSIFLDSPFELEIGSTEYAKALGSRIRTTAHTNYDPDTKTTTTNYHHYADARLKTPYFGHDKLSLSFKAEGVNSYSLHLPDRVLGELYCTFHDVRTHAYGIWWSVTGAYVDDNGIYDSSRNGWRVQSRVALDSLTVISNKIACDVGFVANMKMRQPVEFRNKGRTTRLIGSKRKVFHVTDRMAMKDHLPSFLARGERLARGKADINVLMCASGMDYFFEGQDFFHYALFLAGCKTLVFTYAIGLGDVKDVQWELHDGCIRDNIALGTVSHYDSRYSVFVCLDNQGECLDRQLTLNLQITGLHNEVVSLPISLWNVKTLSDSIRYQKADGILKWSAERKAFDITTLVF